MLTIDLSANVAYTGYKNIVFSETTRPIKIKFHMETTSVKDSKYIPNVNSHMTMMAAMSILGKIPLNIFSGTKGHCPFKVKPFKYIFLCNQKANDVGTWYVALGM